MSTATVSKGKKSKVPATSPKILDVPPESPADPIKQLRECEAGIRGRLQDCGKLLKQIKERDLYQAAGFSTFEDYCVDVWDWGRNYVNKLIRAYELSQELGTSGTRVSERLMREYGKIKGQEKRKQIAEKAEQIAADEKLTFADALRKCVSVELGDFPVKDTFNRKEPKDTPTTVDMATVRKYRDSYFRMLESMEASFNSDPASWDTVLDNEELREDFQGIAERLKELFCPEHAGCV